MAEDGDVLGYAFCVIQETSTPNLQKEKSLYIDDICVDENARCKGVGSAIYKEILRYAKQRRCHNVTLNVWSFNEDALHFYEKCGLKPQRIFMETVLEKKDA